MTPLLRPGDLIGARFRVEGAIGTGGTSVVFAAREETTGRDVAIKVLTLEAASSIDRFLREARMVSRLTSDHVVRVLEVGALDERQPFIVMERLHGIDLGERLTRDGPLPITYVVDCLIQACEALAHAHAVGIVHRDVKPSNLFEHRAPSGPIVKLVDFGISKDTGPDREDSLTAPRSGSLLGSPPYMSPEQIRDPSRIDGRSDLWSLGVVAYRLSSGRLPFDGATRGDIFAAILERPVPPLRALRADLPVELETVIGRCLSRSREARFASAFELASALRPFASPEWALLVGQIEAVARRAASSTPGERGFGDADEPNTVTLTADGAPAEEAIVRERPRRRTSALALGVGAGVLSLVTLAVWLSMRSAKPMTSVSPVDPPPMNEPTEPSAPSTPPSYAASSTAAPPPKLAVATRHPPPTAAPPSAAAPSAASRLPGKGELVPNPYRH